MNITGSAISLNVDDVVASAHFLQRHFGFLVATSADGFASMSRMDLGFNILFIRTGLSSFKPEHMRMRRADGLLIVLVVDDVDGEYDRLRAEGVQILGRPITEPWGERYFQVSDPNGVILQLVQWVFTL